MIKSNRCWFLLVLALLATSVSAQVTPRLTASLVERQLATAEVKLQTLNTVHQPALIKQALARLKSLDGQLRRSVGDNARRPVERLGDRDKVLVYHAQAAAGLTRALVKALPGCAAAEAQALTRAYAASLQVLVGVGGDGALAAAKRLTGLSKGASMAVISGLGDSRQHPVFGLTQGVAPGHLVIHGANLSDPACSDPVVEAQTLDGKALDTQPVIVGVSPAAIEIQWPQAAMLPPGSYALKVTPKKHHLLLGCSSRTPTRTVFAVMPKPVYHVSYRVSATCAASADGISATHTQLLGDDAFPDLDGAGHTVTARIPTHACAFPVSYSISASVATGKSAPRTVGPITQSAQAQITTGLPGQLLLTWNPSMHQLTLTRGARQCTGAARPKAAAASPPGSGGE